MEITIDEWIIHYLAEKNKIIIESEILEKIYKKCDKFVILKGERFYQKISRFEKESKDRVSIILVKNFIRRFIRNSNKTILLEDSDVMDLPDDLEKITPGKDKFLVKTALLTKDKLILTTDAKLKEKINGMHGLNIVLIDEFIISYDC